MGSSSVTNYNNHFVGWVREQNKGGGGGGHEGRGEAEGGGRDGYTAAYASRLQTVPMW